MVSSVYFVYESANFNPRIKVLLFLDSAQVGLLKMYKTTFLGVLEAEKLQKHKCTLFSETPCTHGQKYGIFLQNPTAGLQTYLARGAQVPQQFAALLQDFCGQTHRHTDNRTL